uniref:Tektin n=1 Tax=Parascaris univalens TaxID=6257 RepID=A0A915AMZ9_PARUN
MAFIIKPKPKNNDIRKELNSIKKICANHETLCRSFTKWKADIDENNAQLEILSETMESLRNRHRKIRDRLSRKPVDANTVAELQKEIEHVESQVDIWMKELAEINEARTNLDVEFIRLRSKLQRSMTNIEVANIDFDRIERLHHDTWKNFLHKNVNLT